jgi:hypothetical protein
MIPGLFGLQKVQDFHSTYMQSAALFAVERDWLSAIGNKGQIAMGIGDMSPEFQKRGIRAFDYYPSSVFKNPKSVDIIFISAKIAPNPGAFELAIE